MQRFRWATGVDLSKDLEDITVYGRSYEQDRAVTIFHAKVDQERLMRYLGGRPSFHTSEYGRHRLMSWTERNAKSVEQSMAGCIYRTFRTTHLQFRAIFRRGSSGSPAVVLGRQLKQREELALER